MKARTVTIFARTLLILIGVVLLITALYGGNRAPGAPAAPQLSQLGKRKTATPGVDFQNLSKFKHICFVPNRDQAETNSHNETTQCSIANNGNTIEYSELEKIHLLYNFHYVKYVVRCHTFFGAYDHDRHTFAPAETNPASQYILSHEWNKSLICTYSKNGKSQLRMISFLGTATGQIVRTGTVNKS
jgi:hypothetical protein